MSSSNVIHLPVIRIERGSRSDGGKARILRRRSMLVDRRYGMSNVPRDLIMDHVDVTDTAPCELCGQTGDCA